MRGIGMTNGHEEYEARCQRESQGLWSIELLACHVHPLYVSPVGEFEGGHLALFNRRLVYIEGPALEGSRPGLSADYSTVDSANTLIVCGTAKNVAEFEFVGSSKFSMIPMAAYDIEDGFFAALLKSKVVVVMKCDDRQKMVVTWSLLGIGPIDRFLRRVAEVVREMVFGSEFASRYFGRDGPLGTITFSTKGQQTSGCRQFIYVG
jgi:hypothetical protein